MDDISLHHYTSPEALHECKHKQKRVGVSQSVRSSQSSESFVDLFVIIAQLQ